MKKKQRVAKIEAVQAFKNGDRVKTMQILDFVEQMNGELYIVKAKVLYVLERFDESLDAATHASGMLLVLSMFINIYIVCCLCRTLLESPVHEMDARFIMANCYIKKILFQNAFDQLNLLSILGDDRIDSRRLRAYVAAKLEPPDYDDAILVMNGIVDDYPTDLNMVTCH